jgi:hypothetical protein
MYATAYGYTCASQAASSVRRYNSSRFKKGRHQLGAVPQRLPSAATMLYSPPTKTHGTFGSGASRNRLRTAR